MEILNNDSTKFRGPTFFMDLIPISSTQSCLSTGARFDWEMQSRIDSISTLNDEINVYKSDLEVLTAENQSLQAQLDETVRHNDEILTPSQAELEILRKELKDLHETLASLRKPSRPLLQRWLADGGRIDTIVYAQNNQSGPDLPEPVRLSHPGDSDGSLSMHPTSLGVNGAQVMADSDHSPAAAEDAAAASAGVRC